MCELIGWSRESINRAWLTTGMFSPPDLMSFELQRPKDAHTYYAQTNQNTEMIYHLEWMPPQSDNTVREKHSSKLLA